MFDLIDTLLVFMSIGGGSGFVGRYVQKCFRRKGYNVKIISRNPQKDALTWVRQEVASNSWIYTNFSCSQLLNMQN